MAESVSPMITILALNGVMQDYFRERIVQQALCYRNKASAETRRWLTAAIQRQIKVSGYRHPSSAPVELLIRPVKRASMHSDDLMSWLVQCWVESHEELVAEVREFTLSQGLPSYPSQDSHKGFMTTWPADDMEAMAELFLKAHPDRNIDDVSLMLCCLTAQAPVLNQDDGAVSDQQTKEIGMQPSGTMIEDSEHPIAAVNCDAETSVPDQGHASFIWDPWLSDLEALPPEATEWDNLDAFIDLVRHLGESKLSERESQRSRLCQALSALQTGEAAQELAYFEYDAAAQWSVDAYPLAQAPSLIGLLQDFETLLIRHQARRLQPPTTRAGERERRAQLDSLAGEIEVSYLTIQEELARPRRVAPPLSTQLIEPQPAELEPASTSVTALSDGLPAPTETVAGEQPSQPREEQPTVDTPESTPVSSRDAVTMPSIVETPPQGPATGDATPVESGLIPEQASELEDISVEATTAVADTAEGQINLAATTGDLLADQTGRVETDEDSVGITPARLPESDQADVQYEAPSAPEQLTLLPPADRHEPLTHDQAYAEPSAPIVEAGNTDAQRRQTPVSQPGSIADILQHLTEMGAPNEGPEVSQTALQPQMPPTPELILAAKSRLEPWLGSWSHLPKADLLITWLREHDAGAAATYPSSELCATAYYALQPTIEPRVERCPDLEALRTTLTATPQTELATASWYVAAALVLLQGCLPAWELLEHRKWMSHPNFENWMRMAEAVDAYVRQGTESLPEVAARLSDSPSGPDPKQERAAASKILAELTRPGGFHFLKGQRLSGLMDKELAEVRKSLSQDTPDEAIARWVKHFKPERQLDQWAAQVEPLTVPIEGPVRQALIRDLQSLQMRASRWVRQYAGRRGEEKKARDAATYAFEQLRLVVENEGATWKRTWNEMAIGWPTLTGWSSLLLTRIEEITAVTQEPE